MDILEIMRLGKFSLTNLESIAMSMGTPKEQYHEWRADSWTPRKESAYGETPQEAVENLIIKLDMR
jgi:hypothetical protein